MAPGHPESGQSAAEYALLALVFTVLIGGLFVHWRAIGPSSGSSGQSAMAMREAPYTMPTSTGGRPQWLADIAVH